MFWIRRLWVEIVSLSVISILLTIADELGGWNRRAVVLGGVVLSIVALISAARKIRIDRKRQSMFARLRGRTFSIVGAPASGKTRYIDALIRLCLTRSQADLDVRFTGRLTPGQVDQDVRFTVYSPDRVRPGVWYTMLAFVYRAADVEEGGGDIRESFKEVEHRAAIVLGDQIESYASLTTDSRQDIPREGMLRFVLRFEGIEFNPPERSFLWVEKVHQESFRFRAPRELDGEVVRGRMEVYYGVILIADVGLTITVDSGVEAPQPEPEPGPKTASHGRPYRKIFASYSHKDLAVVLQFEVYVRAFGDEFMRDWTHLRVGEIWSDQLKAMITDADIFQLFWSRNSMASAFVRKEWEYALSLRRASFVRPVYWEVPMPESPDCGLPPGTLRVLHFHHILVESPDDAAVQVPAELSLSKKSSPRPRRRPRRRARKERNFLTLDEAAARLGLNPEHLRSLAARREVRAFLHGGKWRFRTKDIIALVESGEAEGLREARRAAWAKPSPPEESLPATPPPAAEKGEKAIDDDTDFEVDVPLSDDSSDDKTVQLEAASDFELSALDASDEFEATPLTKSSDSDVTAADPNLSGINLSRPSDTGINLQGAGLGLGQADSIELAPLSDEEMSTAPPARPGKPKKSLAATPPPVARKGEKDIFDDTDFEVDVPLSDDSSDDKTVQLEAASDFELEESDSASEVFAIDEEAVDQNAATAMGPAAFAEDEEDEEDAFDAAISDEMTSAWSSADQSTPSVERSGTGVVLAREAEAGCGVYLRDAMLGVAVVSSLGLLAWLVLQVFNWLAR